MLGSNQWSILFTVLSYLKPTRKEEKEEGRYIRKQSALCNCLQIPDFAANTLGEAAMARQGN